MRIAVFTSCQRRHVTLIEELANVADEVYACLEVSTLFPGQVEDFYPKSPVMQRYFELVADAERAEFGEPRFLPENVRVFTMKAGDINRLDLSSLAPIMDTDVAVVFGASYIRSPLVDLLVERQALNIHMGASPYYRGSSCNFWALYDGRPDYVGATIHQLTKGLDSGPMLCHALPETRENEELDGFGLGMRAVRTAIDTTVGLISNGRWKSVERISQDKSLELRYSRIQEFDDGVVSQYLDRAPSPEDIRHALKNRDASRFVLPPEGP